MIHVLITEKGRMTGTWLPPLGVLLVCALASCGGTSIAHHAPPRQPAVEHPASSPSMSEPLLARIPPASAVAMIPTPRAALARCRESKLLRPICPRRVPLSLNPGSYNVADGCANAAQMAIASNGCTLPVWSYEVFAPLSGRNEGARVLAWDGKDWFSPSYAPMDPPPYHVHVDIQAAAGAEPPSIAGPSFADAEVTHGVSDLLLNPKRTRAASFGWVRWYGKRGQLVLAPTNPGGGGEEAGHLIFHFAAAGVNYDISLHAWASKVRITGHGVNLVVRAPQAGRALPHVIATLKAIVGSALSG